jgi:DnaJ-class molecular chaperone
MTVSIVDYECRRCAGKGSSSEDRGEPCFVCLGKGRITLSAREIVDYFRRKK